MQVGFNYPFGYNRFGNQIGPDFNVEPPVWVANNTLEAAGHVSSIPLPPIFDHVDRNLANLRNLGVSIVRWFLLGNGTNYGPPPTQSTTPIPLPFGSGVQVTSTFTPPARLDARFTRDFEELLKRFAQANIRILPSLISFEFGSIVKSGLVEKGNGTVYGGRADVITDPAKRKVFLDTVLGSLLAVSARYKKQIFAWEIINEPYWLCFEYGQLSVPEWNRRSPEVTEGQMSAFLADAVKRIDDAGFVSTVGHRYFDDLKRFPTGTLPQFHYYNEHTVWATIGGILGLGTESDPAQIRGSDLFRGTPKPVVGEFDSSDNRFGDPWEKDLGMNDTTLSRLQLLESEGCDMACIWAELGGAKPDRVDQSILDAERRAIDTADVIKLLPRTRAEIATFTHGTIPPAGE